MVSTVIPPGVQLSSEYRTLSGAAYGVRQSTILGELKVNRIDECNFLNLKSFMDTLLGSSAPDCPYQDAKQALIFHLFQWCFFIQRQQKIPVFGNGYFRKIGDNNVDSASFFVAMPYADANCLVQSLVWVSKVANLFFAKPTLTRKECKAIEQSLATLWHDFRQFSVHGDNTFLFLSAANGLGIPFTQVLPGLYRFGTGKHARQMESTLTDNTSVLGVGICRDKLKTASILRQAGFPVPEHKRVGNAEQAVAAAESFGYPVVVKPADRERGEGVYANLPDSDAVERAFQAASKVSRNILLEKHQIGESYRFTVFNGKVINIFSRCAGGVTGNGINTVAELVELEQQSPRFQRNFRLNGQFSLTLDEEALSLLSEKNLVAENVPSVGERIALRRKSNISAGGAFKNIKNAEVHPDNIVLAIRVSEALKLDFSGIDFIASDIRQSWLETEAIICEVNAMPQIGSAMTIKEYQEVLLEFMQEKFSVDMHLVIYLSSDVQPTCEQLFVLGEQLNCNAFSTKEGIWINRKRYSKPFVNGFESARALLACQEVEAGFSVIGMSEVIRCGLPVDSYKSIRFISSVKELSELAGDRNFNKTCELLQKHSSAFFLYKNTIEAEPSRLKFS